MAEQAYTPPRFNIWLIAVSVALAAFMEVLDTSIASVALPYISGSLGASTDEGNWVITSYLVANAVILPIGSWASSVLGRKRFFLFCIAIFTVSSFLCGIAPSLPLLLLFRILQGAGGGGLVPVAQAILSDTFPPEKRALAFAFFGVVAVLAPSIGPSLGGWITDNFSWRWIFFINIPIGIIALFTNTQLVDDPPASQGDPSNLRRVDGIGFGLLALSMSTLQIALDKGQENDWFNSSFISSFAFVFVVSFTALIIWEWNHPAPLIKIRLIAHRNFAITCVLIFLVGVALNTGINLLPLLQQTFYRYTATLAGESVTPAGVCLIFLFMLAGNMTSRIQLKWMASAGFLLTATGYYVTSVRITPEIGLHAFVWIRIGQVAGLAFLFTSITTAAYAGLPAEDSNQISGITNLLRNLGGSIAISLANAAVVQRAQFHNSRIGDNLISSGGTLQRLLTTQTAYLESAGANHVQAMSMALGSVAQQLNLQANLMAYADVYLGIAVIAVFACILAIFLDTNNPNETQSQGE